MPDTSFILHLLLQSAVIPFTVAAAVSFMLRARHRTPAQASRHGHSAIATRVSFDMSFACAIGLGFLASFFAILYAQWSAIPRQALDWLPWILAAAVAGTVIACRHRPARPGARFLIHALGVTAAVTLIARPALPGLGLEKVVTVIACSVALILATSITGRAGGSPSRLALLPLTLASGAAALALMLDSSQLLGQLCGALSSVLLAIIVTVGGRRNALAHEAAVRVATLLLGILLVYAHLYAGFPLFMTAILVAGIGGATAALALADHDVLATRSSLAIACCCSGVAGAAVIAAALQAAQAAGGY